MRIPLFIFSGLLIAVLIACITVCVINASQITAFNSWNFFYYVHITTLDESLQVILYSACAIVQCLKIKQYLTQEKPMRERKLATGILVITVISLCLLLSHIVCLLWYPGKESIAIIQISYVAIQVILLLPLQHYLFVREPKDAHKDRDDSCGFAYSAQENIYTPNSIY